MTREIFPGHGPILELGPGTGVFTRALLAQGIKEADLTLVEWGSDFAAALKQRFPRAEVIAMDAVRIEESGLFKNAPFGTVISGLPILSMSPAAMISIVGGAFGVLRRGGTFYQFTYGPGCPVPRHILARLGLKAVRIGGTLRNLPPASVYKITRRNPLLMPAPYRYPCNRIDKETAARAAVLAARSLAIETSHHNYLAFRR